MQINLAKTRSEIVKDFLKILNSDPEFTQIFTELISSNSLGFIKDSDKIQLLRRFNEKTGLKATLGVITKLAEDFLNDKAITMSILENSESGSMAGKMQVLASMYESGFLGNHEKLLNVIIKKELKKR